jgi:cytochrome P450
MRVLRRNPLEAWTRAHFEEPISVHDYSLGRVAVISEPSAIRRVLLENTQNYCKDDLQRRILGTAPREGLLTAEGEQWRRQRRVIAPLFAMRAVADMAPAMQAAALDLVARWKAIDGAVVDAAAEMARVTLDVLMRTIFSDGFGGDADQWQRVMREYFDSSGKIHPFDVLGLPAILPRIGTGRNWTNFINSGIERLMAARAMKADIDQRNLLSLLVAHGKDNGGELSEREIKANIFTFIAAGHETTANTITWALFLLAHAREWREALAEEAERAWSGPPFAMAETLVLTRALIDEALRLYPPLVAISRIAIGADRLAETTIKAGTMIVIAPYVLHRHRSLWTDPDIFNPARFLPDKRTCIDRYAYLPFGAGPRVCIGASFALQEATLLLSAITRNFRFELIPQHSVWPLQRITLRPSGGLPLRIECRDRTSVG